MSKFKPGDVVSYKGQQYMIAAVHSNFIKNRYEYELVLPVVSQEELEQENSNE